MTDLYINSELAKKDFKADETYEFTDYMGGSKNLVELKDGSAVIDKHQFTLKTPDPRWVLVYTFTDVETREVTRTFIPTIFANSDEVSVDLPKDTKELITGQVMRAKYAFKDNMEIPTDDLEDLNSYFSDGNGNATDKIVTLNTDYTLSIDGNSITTQPTNLANMVAIYPADLYTEAQKKTTGCIGVSKQIVFGNMIASDLTEPKTFTCNINWV